MSPLRVSLLFSPAIAFVLVHCAEGESSQTDRPIELDAAVSADGVAASEDAHDVDASPSCSVACKAPQTSVALGALDCMATGWAAGGGPSLPFYQPNATTADVNTVVVGAPALPPNNKYTVANGWDGPKPIVPISSWRLSTYTGLDVPDPVSATQRGQVDAYGESGVQVFGTKIGLWLNSSDAQGVFYSGSNSLNSGCWYQTAPLASAFPTGNHELDVAFTTHVAYDGSTGNGHSQAYFQTIFVDRSGKCGTHCAFSFSIGFYSKFAANGTSKGASGDATGTLTMPLAGGGIDATGWYRKMPDSIGYQSKAFGDGKIHFRMSANELILVRNAVAAFAPSYSTLSVDPSDYAISLLNVNGEVYDPCKDPTHIAPCVGGDHSQLGLMVDAFRTTTFVPHSALGTPAPLSLDPPVVTYRTPDGHLAAFTEIEKTAHFKPENIGAPEINGTPSGYVFEKKAHLFFRNAAQHVVHMSGALSSYIAEDLSLVGAPNAASDPKVFTDANGVHRIVYRDASGNLQSLQASTESGSSFTSIDLSRATFFAPAAGNPMGFTSECGTHAVYVDANHRVRLVETLGAEESAVDLLALAGGAEDAYSDPQGFADSQGAMHVVYRDINGSVHEIAKNGATYVHRNLASSAGAPPALGSPIALLGGCDPLVVYQGVDHHLHTLVLQSGTWTHRDLSDVRGAQLTDDDPAAFVDAKGVLRIDYRGRDGQLHEFFGGPTWVHRDL